MLVEQSFQTPNWQADRLMAQLDGDEWKVLTFVVRMALGFGQREARLSLSQFAAGACHRTTGEQWIHGTGCSITKIRMSLAWLAECRLLRRGNTTGDGTLWRIELDEQAVDWQALEDRVVSRQQGRSTAARPACTVVAEPAPPPDCKDDDEMVCAPTEPEQLAQPVPTTAAPTAPAILPMLQRESRQLFGHELQGLRGIAVQIATGQYSLGEWQAASVETIARARGQPVHAASYVLKVMRTVAAETASAAVTATQSNHHHHNRQGQRYGQRTTTPVRLLDTRQASTEGSSDEQPRLRLADIRKNTAA